MDDAALQELLEQLLSSQAKHDQRLAELGQQESLIRFVTEQGMNADPVLIEVLKTLTVMDAAERMQAQAVAALARFVAEQRDLA